MMMPQIIKFVNFTKTQKSRYLENETLFFQIKYNKNIIFLSIKKFIDHTSRATLWQKSFCSGGNF